jgi:hypothetical protein
MMSSLIRQSLAASVLALALVGSGAAHSDETAWQKEHPRRTEVNHRLENQNKRIQTEVKDSKLSKSQAAGLHQEDHQIRTEERDMASQNGSHITKQEQGALNQQENGVSQQIGK